MDALHTTAYGDSGGRARVASIGRHDHASQVSVTPGPRYRGGPAVTTVIVRRGPRRPAPEIPSGDLPIDAPPESPRPVGGRWAHLLMALPLLTGTLATALMFADRGEHNAGPYVVGALFGVSSLSMLALSWGSVAGTPRRSETAQARRDYLRHLAALRRRVRQTVVRQRDGLWYRHPDPHQLWSTVAGHRLWERRPGDADFAVVRVATGPQTLATPLQPPATAPVEDLDPVTADALRRFLDAYCVVPDLPVAVALRGFTRVVLRCPEHADGAAGIARAIVVQLAVFHAPDELRIAFCVAPSRRVAWEWTKWLPHTQHPDRVDAVGPRRLVADTAAELAELLGDLGTDPYVVTIVDGVAPSGEGGTVVEVDGAPGPPDPGTVVLEMVDGRLHLTTVDEWAEVGAANALTVAEAEALARRLAPLRLAAPVAPSTVDAESIGLGDPYAYDVARGWAPRSDRDRLRVAIGVAADGRPVILDLKESAQDGMGPHGLLIGATGSGKSELLRTIVLGLAATHSSETLNLVLVDFKGGATFAPLDRLPHTAAVITNLAEELPLVDRMTDALNGELVRRQELLRRAGNYASVRDYERARAGGAPLDPLPVLLVVCDEFAELLSAKPDFIDLFVQIGRLGRSLGVHLLLASQRLDEGRLRGLDTHLSYRIGLRTFSALESRAVLGGPDAYELPRSPGHGYLRYGTEPMVRFRAAYVSAPYRRPGQDATGGVQVFGTYAVPLPAPVTEPAQDGGGESLLDIVVGRLAGRGVPAHRVWLPPLAASPTVDDLLGGARRPAVRAAPGCALAAIGRGGRSPGDRRWAAQREVHCGAYGGHRSGAASHAGAGAGLLPRLRRRGARRAPRSTARRRGRHTAGVRGGAPYRRRDRHPTCRPGTCDRRSRPAGRVPGHRRLDHAAR
jgi:DNA segregation ATPase FtsK/SpoIIIE, S-DNA-T family